MSENNQEATQAAREASNDELLARLLQIAGPRPAIPADLERRVEASVRREWHKATRRRRVTRWAAVPLALAASVLVVVGLQVGNPPPASPLAIGSVARVAGPGGFAAGDTVHVGDTIGTGPAQSLSFALRDGTSVRLAPETTLSVTSGHDFRLERGALYADTGPLTYRSRSLTVMTPVARITDVGTQFLLRVRDDNTLSVAVREGRVDIARDRGNDTALAGDLLTVRAGEPAEVATVAANAELWSWASAVAPAFDVENRSLMDFLRWAARETGRELVFVDEQRRMAAMRHGLRGSLAAVTDVAPEEALIAVLAASGFDYRLLPDRIVIE